MLQATHLTCEYAVDPLGIGTRVPRFGWWLETQQKETLQAAWQIQVAYDASFAEQVWDSGWVLSDASSQVAYCGPHVI